MQIATLAFGFIPELAAIPTSVRFSNFHAAPERNPSYRFGSVPSFAA